jgi:RNA polymerase sigma-70 factor (ECF subfamily)
VSEESDEIDRLVAAVVAGDRDALNQLLVILRPLIVRYCRSRLGTERGGVAADDVAQEVCLAVLKALPTYIDQGKPFLAFVYGIASHKVVDAHRHAGRDRSEPTDDVPESFADAVGPEQHALEMSASAEMRALLEQLPPKQREILVLRVVVGLSAEETALAVGSTPGAVRVAQHRAVAKLRGVLGEPDESRGPDDTPPRAILDARRLSTRDAAGNRSARRGRA